MELRVVVKRSAEELEKALAEAFAYGWRTKGGLAMTRSLEGVYFGVLIVRPEGDEE